MGAFNTPKSVQNPKCHISLETLDHLWRFGWLRFFILKLLSQSFFVWKKKYRKIHQKIWGGNPVYMPQKDPCSKKKFLKMFFFMESTEFWVEWWCHMSKLTQGGLRYGNSKKYLFDHVNYKSSPCDGITDWHRALYI